MEVIINIFYSFHLLLLHGAAIFDVLVRVGEDLSTSGAVVWLKFPTGSSEILTSPYNRNVP